MQFYFVSTFFSDLGRSATGEAKGGEKEAQGLDGSSGALSRLLPLPPSPSAALGRSRRRLAPFCFVELMGF